MLSAEKRARYLATAFRLVACSAAVLLGCVGHAQESSQRSSRAAAAAYASAAALQQQGLYDLAAQEWQSLIANFTDDPAAPRARYNWGVCEFQQANYQAAAEQFAAVADPEANPQVAEAALANLGLARFNAARSAAEGDRAALYQSTITALEELLKAFPNTDQSALAHFYRGEASAAIGRHAQAAVSFTRLVKQFALSPLAPAGRLGLGEAWLELGKLSDAERELTTLIETEAEGPLLVEAHRTRGEVRLAGEKFADAAEDFAVAADNIDIAGADEARQRQAYCLFRAGDFQGAATAYDRLITDWPESPLVADARLSAAKSLLSAGEAATAAERFHTLWRADPTAGSAAAAHWFARAALAANEPIKEVLPTVEAALATEPDDNWVAELTVDRADLLSRTTDRRAEAIDLYARVAKMQPQQPLGRRAAVAAAQAALETDSPQRAIDLARQTLSEETPPEITLDLKQLAAAATYRLGKHAEAAKLYQGLLDEFPESPLQTAWRLRVAESLAGDEQWSAVVESLQPMVRELDGAAFATGSLLLAKARVKLGETADARETLTRLIDREPSGDALPQALYERGRLDTTVASDPDYRAVIEDFPQHALADYAALGLATNQLTRSDFQAAVATLSPLAKSANNDSLKGQASFLLANAQLELQNYPAALAALESATGPAAEKLYLRGVSESRLGNSDAAQEALTACLTAEGSAAVADRALYELAWLQRGDEQSRSLFARLIAEYPESPLAREAHYRLGAAAYENKQFPEAVKHLKAAIKTSESNGGAGRNELREQARHLLGWVHFDSGGYEPAEQVFRDQLAKDPQGNLASDARVMLAESLFAQEKYGDALPEYRAALAEKNVRDDLRVMALLHAGQAAGQTATQPADWQTAYALLDKASQSGADSSYQNEIAYERAWALSKLGKPGEARPEFERLAAETTGVLSARARFVLGELQFAAKEYEEAVRTFFKVAYGYGGADAPDEFHAWQAESLFEAARCLELMDRRGPARKLYAELLERFPDAEKAPHARHRLQPSAAD